MIRIKYLLKNSFIFIYLLIETVNLFKNFNLIKHSFFCRTDIFNQSKIHINLETFLKLIINVQCMYNKFILYKEKFVINQYLSNELMTMNDTYIMLQNQQKYIAFICV
jgi:hypothetical protein